MSQPYRLERGGLIDRSQTTRFTFDGESLCGHPGDTLASALLANGTRLVGRSFKYHRPRGIMTSGVDEPNGLVEVSEGPARDPNTPATTLELYDGLCATSQNRYPSLKHDWLSVNRYFSAFLGAGFYYKTFMWPAGFWEKVYEPIIRRAAGLGALSGEADPSEYDKGFLHCDLLIIGAGPAGLIAAQTAAESGAEVILVDNGPAVGGRLLGETLEVDGQPGAQWANHVSDTLAQYPNVRVLTRATLFSVYDGGLYAALERLSDHLADPPAWAPRQRLWRIRAKRSILAAGSLERPIAFGNNDRPGIMLAGAARTYLNQFAVAPTDGLVIFTNNDSGWRTAHDYVNAGVRVKAILDTRFDAVAPDYKGTDLRGVPVVRGARVVNTRGRHALRRITYLDGDRRRHRISTDLLAVSGGWNPVVHLTCHHGTKPTWNAQSAAFVPSNALPPGMHVVGAAAGEFSTAGALVQGVRASQIAMDALGYSSREQPVPVAEDGAYRAQTFWYVRESAGPAFIDFQNDVSTKDLGIANQEGFRAIEHLKRYTTLGMATDQGKTSNVVAIGIMSELTGQSMADTGTTIFRPPYTGVPIAAFAGRSRGSHFRPVRYTPSHQWALEQGAVFTEAGLWLRAQWFPLEGDDDWRDAVNREVLGVRRSVGVCDVTTLGKIDIQGRDAAEFLDRVYANNFATLKLGRARYGLMLREDGLVMDDGTCARLGEYQYVMTTTTANAVPVARHLEFCRQVLWPTLDVQTISVTEQWAQYAVAGPHARDLLRKIIDTQYDISHEVFPYMAAGEVTLCGGVPGRLFRLSFSGELGYEIAVPARYGDALIRALMAAGEEFDVVPYGTEALSVMRIEKGHPAGAELNGTTTAGDLGMGRLVAAHKDCIGKIMSTRPGLNDADRPTLVGLRAVSDQYLTAGSHFLRTGQSASARNSEGYMTSVAYSPTLRASIGLGMLARGPDRMGERLRAVDLVREKDIEVEVVSPHFYDPEGGRLRV
ncbi:MAG: sarcosine oxidase subunit alpha family protein [Pseudomonadota bacterium]